MALCRRRRLQLVVPLALVDQAPARHVCDAGGVEATGRVYAPAERPLIEVLVDETWRPGELRAWSRREDDGWWGNVSWSAGPGMTYLDTVPATRLRPVADENADPSCRRRT